MNRVEIATRGPVEGNLTQVLVSDDYDNDTFHIDHAQFGKAELEGLGATMKLIASKAGPRSLDILQAGAENGSPVYLDNATIDTATLAAALNLPAPAPQP